MTPNCERVTSLKTRSSSPGNSLSDETGSAKSPISVTLATTPDVGDDLHKAVVLGVNEPFKMEVALDDHKFLHPLIISKIPPPQHDIHSLFAVKQRFGNATFQRNRPINPRSASCSPQRRSAMSLSPHTGMRPVRRCVRQSPVLRELVNCLFRSFRGRFLLERKPIALLRQPEEPLRGNGNGRRLIVAA